MKQLSWANSLSSDIQGGINAGIKTCWYNPRNLTTPDNMKINYVIGNLEELSRCSLKKRKIKNYFLAECFIRNRNFREILYYLHKKH